MHSGKYNRMIATYDGFKGDQTIKAIESSIPEDLKRDLTGRQLGMVMSILHAAYQKGIARGEKHEDTDGCVYVDGVGLIPLDIIRQIKIVKTAGTKKYTLSVGEDA
jgi:hypothetical protein